MTDKFEMAYKEFHDKTEWIQQEMNSGKIACKYWGMHRADVIKAIVYQLREEIKQKDKIIAEYRPDLVEKAFDRYFD